MDLQQPKLSKPQLTADGNPNEEPSDFYTQNPTLRSSFNPTANKFINLPKLKLPEFSGNPLEWPEWSSLFLATVDSAGIDNSLKMNHLKTLVTGRAKAAIDGMGYSGEMYPIAWNTLQQNFGRTKVIVNAQLRQIYSFPFIKPNDSAAIIKFAQTVSTCVNVLTLHNCTGDLQSEAVLNSIVRKLSPELKQKWFFHVAEYGVEYADAVYFREWLNNVAYVHDNIASQFPTQEAKKSSFGKDKAKPNMSSFVANTSKPTSKSNAIECVFKDGEHKLWECPKFKAQTVKQRFENVKKFNLCFICFSNKHPAKDCKSQHKCGVDGCNKRHNRILHSTPAKEEDQPATVSASSNLLTIPQSGHLQLIKVVVSNPHSNKRQTVVALCDSGSTVSYVDQTVSDDLKLRVMRDITMNVAGILGQNDMRSQQAWLHVQPKIGRAKPSEIFAFTHPNLNIGSGIFNFNELKKQFSHLSKLPNDVLALEDVKMVIGQDVYHLCLLYTSPSPRDRG